MPNGALAGVKVLDLSQYVAGPYCTKMLADYGAEVIKIEKPGVGDKARQLHSGDPNAGGPSPLFLYLNTNKKSITLDLKSERDRNAFLALSQSADVVVEGYRPGVMSRLGLDYAALEKVNPRLVVTSISNFGQSGPYRDYKATHIVACALAGWSYCGGEEDREPLQAAGMLGFFVAGASAATGTLTALHHRRESGVGQHVDVSIMEAMLPMTTMITIDYSFLGRIRRRLGNCILPGYGFIAQCQDGFVGVNCLTNEHWELLCHFIGKSEILENPKYLGPYGRLEHARELSDIVASWFVDKIRDEVFQLAAEWRLPLGLILKLDEVLETAQYRERGLFVPVPHPKVGTVMVPGAPFKMSASPWQMRYNAPRLGEHNEEILARVATPGTE